MSTYYDIHTEIRIGDEWICIDPFVYNPRSKEFQQRSTFWSGSRSCFDDAYKTLEKHGARIQVEECSEYVAKRNEFRLKYKDDPYASSFADLLSVPYETLCDLLKDKPEHTSCGYVDKSLLRSHQIDDTEIWEWLSVDEFRELSPEEQQGYEWYEWDDEMHWLTQLRHVHDKVSRQLNEYRSENCLYEDQITCRLVIGIT